MANSWACRICYKVQSTKMITKYEEKIFKKYQKNPMGCPV